jgi:hypothetical protein
MFSPETLQALARMHYMESEKLARQSRVLRWGAAPRVPTESLFARLARWLAAPRHARPAQPELKAEALHRSRLAQRRPTAL